jgi:hypothetical protein
MNCFYHSGQMAVAQCPDCGKGLCSACASLFSQPICKSCFNKRIKSTRSIIIKELLVTFGFGLAAILFVMKNHTAVVGFEPLHHPQFDFVVYFMFFYAASGIVSGWKTLTAITPQVFLFLPLLGWLFYFLIKFVLAFFVGFVAFPIRTVRNFIKLNQLKPEK